MTAGTAADQRCHGEPGPAAGVLASEFPGWEITLRPGGLGIVTAYWQSGDGAHRRCIVARSAAELLSRLRAIRAEEPQQ